MVECIVIKQKKGVDVPLVMYPHGGPHTSFVNEFVLYPVALACAGFAVALVNYSGSTGYGEEWINRLIGHIGEYDVRDTHEVCLHLLKSDQMVSKNKVFVMGGSHGGYIGAFLTGMFPVFLFFTCRAFTRRPVCAIPSLT